jgi:futalosine hydrolase
MKILLTAATSKELEPILSSFGKKPETTYAFQQLEITKHISSVGIASTAYSLGKIFAIEKFDIAIQIGIAGAYQKNCKLGEVYQVLSDRFLYFGAEEDNFIPISKLNLGIKEDIYFQKFNINLPLLSSLKKAKAITSQTIHTKESSIEKIMEIYDNPQLESMEGAAFFYACKQSNTPCLQIRSISNYVGKRNKSNWDIDFAIRELKRTILQLLQEISNHKS